MKTEAKVVLSVVAVLLVAEVAARVLEPRLSKDVRNILAHREIPGAISDVERKGGTSLLVIGNSLARACVNEEVLEEELSRKGYPGPEVFFMTPDASAVNEWTAAYRKYFPPGQASPDMVLIVTGPEHLLDHPVRSPEKLAAFHAAPGDRGRMIMEWLEGGNPRARFLLASVSRLFASRERIRPLLFYNFVPGFEETARRINQAFGDGAPPGRERPTATRFASLLDSIQAPPACVFVVAAPLPEQSDLPPEVGEIAAAHEVMVLDEGSRLRWPDDAFPDGYHLGKPYSRDFTRKVAPGIPARPDG